MLYANTVEGQAEYSLYEIDSNQVFYLLEGTPQTHTDPAQPREEVRVDTTTYTTFTNYTSRMGVAPTNDGTYYSSLEALDNGTADDRTLPYVSLRWNAVENATEYDIYTTNVEGNDTAWVYVDSWSPDPMVEEDFVYGHYDFYLSSYPIAGYRAVRVVPKNNNQVDNTPAEIELVDTVRPVSSLGNNDNTNNAFAITTNFGNTHDQSIAHTEGHIVAIAGTKNLSLVGELPATVDEAYAIINLTGGLVVTIPSANQAVGCALMPLTIADVEAEYAIPATSTLYMVGTNLVGALASDYTLTVYAHLACASDGTDIVDYNGTTVAGNLYPTYADLSGNLMVTPDTSVGTITFVEQ